MESNPYYRFSEHSHRSPEDSLFFEKREGFVFMRSGSVRSLLPGEQYSFHEQTEESCVYITPDATAACVAGAGEIQQNNGLVLSGWCSFSCRLISARRFAVRCKAEFLQNLDVNSILVTHMRCALKETFEQTAASLVNPSDFDVRAYAAARFPEKAKHTLMDIGWLLTACRLEKLSCKRSCAHETKGCGTTGHVD